MNCIANYVVRGDWGENSYQVRRLDIVLLSIARLVYRKSKPLCVLSAGKICMLHAVWFIRDTVVLRLYPILGRVS